MKETAVAAGIPIFFQPCSYCFKVRMLSNNASVIGCFLQDLKFMSKKFQYNTKENKFRNKNHNRLVTKVME